MTMGIIYNIGDSGDDAKVCVMEAPANEDNELDTLLLLGQLGYLVIRSPLNLRS